MMDCHYFQTKINEESRLAVTVHQIDEEVSVVPRGAFIKSPRGLVHINRSFVGNIYQSNCGAEYLLLQENLTQVRLSW